MSVNRDTGATGELRWFKSSHSGSGGGDCVEVATTRLAVHVRDTKTAGQGPTLRVGHAPWAAFVAHTGT
ncbi:DUF397 domain-containing protein [Streptomyces nitrosporeus]|uniref:DUF397 domain-containing protein n=1 Tax=Streptomyces nitrosporeus TaxID=28894 RepID=A0A5J6F5L8_9ACTN|nr:DUF397 domain-containing protein [Streptomyces nitrosporeus]QEU71084.1 DUF397 domain-containing protein [Streptomyces nitrosporeus]GGZ14954.1 hypothetical protein GCM10010327_52400 [Streptomyces nitrosporeus]